jgi:hypothetical protein
VKISLFRDRLWLQQTWLWWKHTWWFQLAHGPLCTRQRTNVFRIGPCYLCRSCTLLYFALASMLVGLAWVRPPTNLLALGCFTLLVPLLILSYPWLYRALPRLGRDAVRLATGVFLAFLFALFLTNLWWLAGLTLVALFLVFRYLQRQRRQVKQSECLGCPELRPNHICSGYSHQSAAIRTYCIHLEEELNRPERISLLMKTKKIDHGKPGAAEPQAKSGASPICGRGLACSFGRSPWSS